MAAFGATSWPVFGSGSTTPAFDSTPMAAFGATSSSAFGSTTPAFGSTSTAAFGATSSPLFGSGSTTPAFGSTSAAAFGATTSPGFGSSPAFGLTTPAFGSTSAAAFGATTSPVFGSSPAFGLTTHAFGSTLTAAFGATSSSLFGSGSTTPAFGSTSTAAFGATSSPLFQSTPAFGLTTPAFGSTSTAAFTATSSPLFGSGSTTPAFGSISTAAFGATSSPLFGSTPTLGSTSMAAFGATSSPLFGSGSTTPAFGSTLTAAFGATSSPRFGSGGAFGASSNAAFGGSCSSSLSFRSSPAFEASETAFRSNQFGSGSYGAHIASQVATPTFGRAAFANSSFRGQHRGSRVTPFTPTAEAGGPKQAGQSGVSVGRPSASPAIPRPTFSQSSPFSSTTASNAVSSAPASATTSYPVAPTTSGNAAFWPSTNPSLFSSSSLTVVVRSPTFAIEVSIPPSMFSTSVLATLGSAPSVISAPTTPSSSLFWSTTPPIAETASAFIQTPVSSCITTAPFGQTITPTFGQMHTFSTASSSSGGSLFPSTPSPILSTNAAAISQSNPSFSLPFQTSEAAETSGVCSLGDLGQTQAAGTGGFGSQYAFGQSHCGQSSINGSSSVVQPALVTNASGTVPAILQLSIGCTETGSSVQYGTSSMPVPFSCDGDNTPSKPEADAQVIPRGNPRSLVVGPEYRPAREQEPSPLKKTSPCANDGVSKDGPLEEQTNFVQASQKMKGVHDVIIEEAGESSIRYDCDAGIEALMPKLCQPDHYTEPHVKELAAKERAEPGFCRRVKDFIIGRLGSGHIEFVGETNVRTLDLDSLVRFNNREVILNTDESKKLPIGKGINKPAEVTLLNMKCIDKKTGKQYIEGPKVEKYKEILKKVAEEQGAEFVSYDPIKGEWKFKVRHFS